MQEYFGALKFTYGASPGYGFNQIQISLWIGEWSSCYRPPRLLGEIDFLKSHHSVLDIGRSHLEPKIRDIIPCKDIVVVRHLRKTSVIALACGHVSVLESTEDQEYLPAMTPTGTLSLMFFWNDMLIARCSVSFVCTDTPSTFSFPPPLQFYVRDFNIVN